MSTQYNKFSVNAIKVLANNCWLCEHNLDILRLLCSCPCLWR